jgi:hypothetical protein
MGPFRNGGIAAHPLNPSLASHRAAPATAANLALMLLSFQYLTGCATSEAARPPIHYTGDPLTDGQAALAAADPKDRVLWQYRIGAEALRRGNFGEAKNRLDDAILTLGGQLAGPDEAARRARGYFNGETEKTFIGEPYERVMAYFYRSIIYWRDGEPDNARACFRSAALHDADMLAQQYASDYVLLDYLDGFATARLGGDGAEAYARAQANSKLPLPQYDRSANVLCFVEYGHGPIKYATGEYGEELRFATSPSRAHSAVLTVEKRKVALPPYDDLNFQAVTRGGRVMDHILRNKAVFKGTTDTLGDLAITGAVIAHDHGPKQDKAAAVMAAAGVISKVLSASTNARADTRTWDNLPQYLSFAALRLAPGSHAARLEFYDANGRRLPEFTQNVMITVADPSADTVVFLSQLSK